MKDLTISIVSWNNKELLRRCLNSIYQNTSVIEYKIIVVDNNSSDGSSVMVKSQFPEK